MIDEAARLDEQVQAGKLPTDVFGHIRSLMQHSPSLNFIFCVGERLEFMQGQYALLFSVALYKEISFLDRNAAEALIAHPADGLFTYDESVVDRIIEITSGHAYFLQLLCHSLFAHWQRDSKSHINAHDVNSVVSEVVERGSANLKFEWDESLPVEKLFLGAMAEAMEDGTSSLTPGDVDAVLRRYDILIPKGEVISAQRSLIGKELVFGTESVRFAIDFLRLWVRQHARLEWVKEELSTKIGEYREIAEAEIAAAEKQEARKRFRWGALAGAVGLVVVLLLFVPGSPARLFSASKVTEAVSVAQTFDFTNENSCGFQKQAAGAILAMCIDTVEVRTDKTLRFNVHWTANITTAEFNAVERAKSEVGDPEPYIQDNNGNIYNFSEVQGAATLPISIRHGKPSDAGSFIFPPLPAGAGPVTLVHGSGQQEMRIEGIVLK